MNGMIYFSAAWILNRCHLHWLCADGADEHEQEFSSDVVLFHLKNVFKCFCISRASLKENNGLINTKQAAQRRCKQRLWFWIITILHRSEKHPPGYKKKTKKTSKLIIHKACCPTNQQLGLPLCAALLVEFPLVSQRQRLLSQKHREGVVFITPRDLASILPPGSARPGPARPDVY